MKSNDIFSSTQPAHNVKVNTEESGLQATSKPSDTDLMIGGQVLINTELKSHLFSDVNCCHFCKQTDASTINCSFRRCSVYFHPTCAFRANLILSSEKMMQLGEILHIKSFVNEPVFCLAHLKHKYKQLQSFDLFQANQFYLKFLSQMLPPSQKVTKAPSLYKLSKSQKSKYTSAIKTQLFNKLKMIRTQFLVLNEQKLNNIYYEINPELSIILFDKSVDLYDLNDFDKFFWAFMVINGLLDKKEFIKHEAILSMFGDLVKTFKLEKQTTKVKQFIFIMRQNYLTMRDRQVDEQIYQQQIKSLSLQEVQDIILID